MAWTARIRSAARAALAHLALSMLVAASVAWLVFGVWYPTPFHELTGGRTLFLILMAVDVVCGPVLTLVLFDPAKSRFKWRLDLALIVFTQLTALAYGLNQVAAARPVFVAFEGDRFRLVQALDIDESRLQEAPSGVDSPGFRGPRVLGVQLSRSTDPDYLSSLQLSLQGLHPAFRPARWRPYEQQASAVQLALQPLALLRQKNPTHLAELEAALAEAGLKDEDVGYLPLVREEITDWVALIRRSDSQPFAYLHLDGW
ncbi:TfpX/TfpZ family type IV pilin accessory protein [Hydrogenophaga sp. IBVHS1]|uniref:TfpX/TfpZ family type IV pilin accessory protein n=1 Tax=Hydrogenophaga sp. IBVHS1 TaxID=1985169 RepID=UPI0026BC9ACB|nr:TfpX/TfpZ family type IV pilin accessory protein [Hydrogenophaga sp. IBVHS1]